MNPRTQWLAAAALAVWAGLQAGAATWFVAEGAAGAATGEDWANAFPALNQALAVAGAGDAIWVAEGTYTPGANRGNSFTLPAGVALYGGFTTAMSSLGERNWTNHLSILDGDLDQDGTRAGNAYHVVRTADGATLDGFTIANGVADGAAPDNSGAGILHATGLFTLRNCTVRAHFALQNGGGMYNAANVNAQLETCLFLDNSVSNGTATVQGGALFNTSCTGDVVNCTFIGNYSHYRGGAAYNDGSAKPVFDGCTFLSNQVGTVPNYGGSAFYAYGTGGAPTFCRCTFVGNSSTYDGGTVVLRYAGTLDDCVLRGNAGGLVLIRASQVITIRNCQFIRNVQPQNSYGLGINSDNSHAIVSDCTFVGGSARTKGGALRVTGSGYTMTVDDCLFVNNFAGDGGGAAFLQNSARGVFRDCVFAGNRGHQYGGGTLALETSARAALTNCLLVGGVALRTDSCGGAIRLVGGSTLEAANCTIAANAVTVSGGALYADASTASLLNSIVWTNTAGTGGDELYANNSTVTVGYTDLQGGWDGAGVVTANGGTIVNAGGNLDADPLFAGTLTGQWTADGAYDAVAGQTVLTSQGAGWTPGALAGKFVQPDPGDADVYLAPRQYAVVMNDAHSVTVWGDATHGKTAEAYGIHDYHLRSKWGRWTALGWVVDPVHSPCIDAGAPVSSLAREPDPNGGIVNLGAYGNTAQASLRYKPIGSLLLLR